MEEATQSYQEFIEKALSLINEPILHIGQTPLTLGGLLSAIFVVALSFVISYFLQRIVLKRVLKRFPLTSGQEYAFQRILHYVIILIGVIIATQMVGLNFGALAVVFGFLSVGIGFGLQNVTSNFISGVILLFERPVAVGDFVDVDGTVGTVQSIHMRSTTVITNDNVSIIVPNSKFIEESVTNWSYLDPKVRIHCPVGVAYGSNTALVKEVLLKVAKEDKDVLDYPSPDVFFNEFGDSSLNFTLLIWISRSPTQNLVKSRINFAIDAAFRENGVEIPFPQRDLHVKMTPAIEKLSKST